MRLLSFSDIHRDRYQAEQRRDRHRVTAEGLCRRGAWGYVDEVHGRHLPSRSILEAIERQRPALALCGHVHQCWGGEAAIGTTPVVNLGPEGRFFDI